MNPFERAQLDLEPNTLFIPGHLLVSASPRSSGSGEYPHLPLDPPIFTPEAQGWCDEFLSAGTFITEWTRAKFKHGSPLQRLFDGENDTESPKIDVVVMIAIIRFTDERDLIMFRLRWGDC